MDILKKLGPEFRRKLNIGLLVFTGLQFFMIFILSVFFSNSESVPVPRHSYEPAAAIPVPPAQPEEPAAVPKPEKREDLERTPQSHHAKGIKKKIKKIQIAKKPSLARKLPPLKVAKQVHHTKPGKRSEDSKVVAKAPANGSASQAERW